MSMAAAGNPIGLQYPLAGQAMDLDQRSFRCRQALDLVAHAGGNLGQADVVKH
jgi:hypothetical protein